MTGVKGRSGKATTPEAHAAKVRAARLGGNAKAGRGQTDTDDVHDAEKITDKDILALLPGTNPYDHVVLKTRGKFTYLDGKTREQVNGEVLTNEKLTVAILQARGDLQTREQIEARDERHDEIILRNLNSVVDLAAGLVTPDRALEAQTKAKDWLRVVRVAIAAEIDREDRQ